MISRTRKRPRDKSVSFRTFWWVLQREATLRICDNAAPGAFDSAMRRWLAGARTVAVVRLGVKLIFDDRGRRFWP